MPKILSKSIKTQRKIRERLWKDRVESFLHKTYGGRVVLLGNTYLSEYEDGTVEVYASISPRPSLNYGISYHIVFRGKHGTPIIHKWIYPCKDKSVEEIWKEACDVIDEIVSREIIDKDYLITHEFEWD